MLDLDLFQKKFIKHISTQKSSSFLLNVHASFECWFKVELVPILQEIGFNHNQINTNFGYPDCKDKADLAVKTQDNKDIVFELKIFVKNEDSIKKETYPIQIKRLEKLFDDKHCVQAVTLTTFFGYSDTQMKNYLEDFFVDSRWKHYGLRHLGKKSFYLLFSELS